MNAVELSDAIAQLCETDTSVTHGTLRHRFGEDAVIGDYQISLEENLVMFVGASKSLADAIQILRKEHPARVVLRPIEFLCHIVDRSPIPRNMPMAQRVPKNGYKTPHFVSLCFSPAKGHEKYIPRNQQDAG